MPLVGEKIETTDDHFGNRVRKNYLTVDKSSMIQEFWEGPDVSLITRPRRFGKTLNLSMLQHFFAAEVHGQPTVGLFDNFSIAQVAQGEFIQQHQGKYPVIFISFKDAKEDSFDGTISKIKVLMQKLYREHKNLLAHVDEDYTATFQKYLTGSVNPQELEDGLRFLSKVLYKAYGRNAIILIDEYDSPLTSAYHHGFIDKLSNFLCNLFSAALKTNGFLEKGLMMGIVHAAKNNMSSGLNNLEVYTVLDKEYRAYFGFTEEEVEALIKNKGAIHSLQEVRNYYKGYTIGSKVLYNPLSVMQYLDEKELVPYWVMTANDPLLKKVLLDSPVTSKRLLHELMQGQTIEQAIHVNLLYEDLLEKSEALWTLLLFCGYLTVESSKEEGTKQICQLRIPNAEVLQQYMEVFSDWLKEKIKDKGYNSLLKSLIEGRVEEFTHCLTGCLFSCTSSHDFQAEADYYCFVLGLLASISHTHFLYSNKEYGAGRLECLLIPKEIKDPEKAQGIILEFKHFHFRSEAARRGMKPLKEVSHDLAKTGLEQSNLRGYSYVFHQHQPINKVLQVGMAFSNRIVSTAYVLIDLVNGEESVSSSPAITLVDVDESLLDEKDKISSARTERSSDEEDKAFAKKRRRILIEDDEEEHMSSSLSEASSFSAYPAQRLFSQSASSVSTAWSSSSSSHAQFPEVTEKDYRPSP